MSLEEVHNAGLVKELLEKYFVLGPNGNEMQESKSTFYMKHGYVKKLILFKGLTNKLVDKTNEIQGSLSDELRA